MKSDSWPLTLPNGSLLLKNWREGRSQSMEESSRDTNNTAVQRSISAAWDIFFGLHAINVA